MDESGPAASSGDLASRTRVDLDEPYDKQLAPLGSHAISALSVLPGDRILDIGCGTGRTSVELGYMVGPQGKVLGIDLSAIVLETATQKAAGSTHVSFVNGDAQVFPFEPGSYDAAFSRFGIMFFNDPVAAFINIRKALKPGGRLAFVCWRSLQESELDTTPLRAASPHLPQGLPDWSSSASFSFARQEFTHSVLERAGFQNIEISGCDEQVGSGGLESMLELTLRVGSLGRILREAPELRALVHDPVRDMLVARDGPGGPKLNAAIWVVKATS